MRAVAESVLSATSATTVVAAVLSGVAGVLLASLLTRRKQHLDMEKTREEITKLRRENAAVDTRLKEVEDRVLDVVEEVLYDSGVRGALLGHELEGRGGRIVTDSDAAEPAGAPGQGRLAVLDDGVIDIERFTVEGRFEIALRHYRYGGADHEFVPRRPAASGRRRFQVTLEAKVASGPHTLRFTLREMPDTSVWQSQSVLTVSSRTWTSVRVPLTAAPSVDCWLRIDDQELADAPSSIQLRRLRLTELTAAEE